MPLPIPKFIKTAFANIGLRNNIPEITNNTTGAAGYDRGFGEINMLPEGAGGIPPDGKDFNGVLYDLSQAIQYVQSGVAFPFNQEFATAIGGYSVKAIVADPSDPTILWQNDNANNTLPPSTPNGWTQVFSAADLLRDPTTVLRGAPYLATVMQAKDGTAEGVMLDPKTLKDSGLWPLGVGQTWSDVTASRVIATNYTNSTGRPIFIAIRLISPASGDTTSSLLVNGLIISSNTRTQANEPSTHFAIVPPGSTYRIDTISNTTIGGWMELRS